MTLVLDVSGAVEVVLGRSHAKEIEALLIKADWVVAPELFIYEASNVFWKYYAIQRRPKEQCEAALKETLALPDEYFPGEDLALEAFAWSCLTRLPTYDMYYAVLARRYDATLVTRDRQLEAVCQQHNVRVVTGVK